MNKHFQAKIAFTSKHGHKYKKGVVIGWLRYRLLSPEDKANFEVLTPHESTMLHHTTHEIIDDSDSFYDPVPGFIAMEALSTVLDDSPSQEPAQQPDTNFAFGGGSGGGAGAGGDFGPGPDTNTPDTNVPDMNVPDTFSDPGPAVDSTPDFSTSDSTSTSDFGSSDSGGGGDFGGGGGGDL